eukprot:TRINITY_DN42507_c0_g1_i1.p1 TRINITY_DN42507_c0_g1~~TRINITY_DN42507_c0_g1_i1.p1  ORF type:complete len:192 (+),score=33.06 TRINITY_DN42507_c0_g1_i1:53-628(+)
MGTLPCSECVQGILVLCRQEPDSPFSPREEWFQSAQLVGGASVASLVKAVSQLEGDSSLDEFVAAGAVLKRGETIEGPCNRIIFCNDTAQDCTVEVFQRERWGRRGEMLYHSDIAARSTAPAFEPLQQSQHFCVCFRSLDGEKIDEIGGVTCESGDVQVRLRGSGPGPTCNAPPMASLQYPRRSRSGSVSS